MKNKDLYNMLLFVVVGAVLFTVFSATIIQEKNSIVKDHTVSPDKAVLVLEAKGFRDIQEKGTAPCRIVGNGTVNGVLFEAKKGTPESDTLNGLLCIEDKTVTTDIKTKNDPLGLKTRQEEKIIKSYKIFVVGANGEATGEIINLDE